MGDHTGRWMIAKRWGRYVLLVEKKYVANSPGEWKYKWYKAKDCDVINLGIKMFGGK